MRIPARESFREALLSDLLAMNDEGLQQAPATEPCEKHKNATRVVKLEDADLEKLAAAEGEGCTSLERVVLGAKTNPFGNLPSSEVRGRTDWFSEKERRWFTAHEIGESRLGISDTYTKG